MRSKKRRREFRARVRAAKRISLTFFVWRRDSGIQPVYMPHPLRRLTPSELAMAASTIGNHIGQFQGGPQ